jgi:hypothetical protein
LGERGLEHRYIKQKKTEQSSAFFREYNFDSLTTLLLST